MKKKSQQRPGILSIAYPTASSPYWRSLPIRRMKRLLAGVFFSAAVVGFAFDLLQLPLPPLDWGFFWPLVLGGSAVGVLVTRTKGFLSFYSALLCSSGWLGDCQVLAGTGWAG